MRIGIAYDLKPDSPPPEGAPDDWAEEFDSMSTIEALADVFRHLGHTPLFLGNGREFLEKILVEPPDFVFNFAEGVGTSRTREARIPAVCELLDIPYTGSDPLALSLALEKDLTRRLAIDAGVAVPNGITLVRPELPYDGNDAEFAPMLSEAGLVYPVIAKPVFEGSSKGIRNRCLIRNEQELGPIIRELWSNYQQSVLIEEYIDGEEITLGLLGNSPPQIFGIMAIRPRHPVDQFVYSLEVKRDFRNQVTYHCPPGISDSIRVQLEVSALSVWESIGCRDVARLDFRIRDGVPYFLEINPLPGLNPSVSDLCIMAELQGVSYKELVGAIFEAAQTRFR